MIKRTIRMAAVLLAMAAVTVSCQEDADVDTPAPEQKEEDVEGTVGIRIDVVAERTEEYIFSTRAVDPDGGGVQDITLFCFDDYGLFITTATANLTKTNEWSGTLTTKVPTHTRRVHFVANQNMSTFSEQAFINKSEGEVMAMMEGSAGHMIYWGHFQCDRENKYTAEDVANGITTTENIGKVKPINVQLKETLGDRPITLLRNHALIRVANPKIGDRANDAPANDDGTPNGTLNDYFEVTGMAVSNIVAFGTVAPYHPVKGFNFSVEEWYADNFVTIPQRNDKQSDITAVTSNTSQYIFEQENTSEDPVSVILRGHAKGQSESDDLYYRVMLIDGNGNYVPVRRNFRYNLIVKGALSYGQPTFDEALTAPATNNVWISISDEVNEVENRQYILHVDETFKVIDADELASYKSYSFHYTVTRKDGTPIDTAADKPEISWIDNEVAASSLGGEFTADEAVPTVGNGTIIVTPRALGSSNKLEGTILVKLGLLQRKIKVVLVKKQGFNPAWISTAIYGKWLDETTKPATGDRPHVSCMFTIPDDCPAELFPMNVYITVDHLDVRSEAGFPLPVITKSDPEWAESCSGDFRDELSAAQHKYVYTVQQPGTHRLYFESILTQDPETAGTKWIYFEAKHFTTLRKSYVFSDTRNAIMLRNTKRYRAAGATDMQAEDDWGWSALDEYIYYLRVPQKTGANVTLEMWLRQRESDQIQDFNTINLIDAQQKDEFLFYSKNLTNYNAEIPGEVPNAQVYFQRYNEKAQAWQQAQNPNGGRMLMFKPIQYAGNRTQPDSLGKYKMYLFTNCPRSAEPVRISSNVNWQPAVSTSDPDDRGADGLYGGEIYRSFIFELVNYTPFRFGARVKYANQEWAGAEPDRGDPKTHTEKDVQEMITPLTFTYEPGQPVDISFDVTSFEGPDSDNDSKVSEGDETILDDPDQPATETVDPFGREFEIYIDAPMLQIDNSRLAECKLDDTKLKADPTTPGRFIYTVAADREAERAFGTGAALNIDNSPENPDQTGERKTLPFKVRGDCVASAGDIVLSSNEDQVVFYKKTFRVTNESIKGRIECKHTDGELVPVAKDAFVAFERAGNLNRIGAITITEDGQFELRLRKEYDLQWDNYKVAFHYEHTDAEHGTHLHHAIFNSLADLYQQVVVEGKTVVLDKQEFTW